MSLAEDVHLSINHLPKKGIFSEGNMENIFVTIPINISTNPDVIENVHIGANCSLEEVSIYISLLKEFRSACAWSSILGIDPYIVEHGI